MRTYIILFFSVLIFLSACSDDNPKGVIKEEKMAAVLTDVHIVDGGLNNVLQVPDTLYKYGFNKYIAVFKRHGIDSVQFHKSFNWYATHPEKMDAIYDDVLKRIQTKTDSVNKIKPKKLKELKNALPQ